MVFWPDTLGDKGAGGIFSPIWPQIMAIRLAATRNFSVHGPVIPYGKFQIKL
jgi:hypothetical protein